MPYRLSALAEQDLEEIWSYVAEDASSTTADRLIDAIFDRFELLVEQPRIGRNRPEFGEGVRSFVVESYVIYYRHDGDLLIARVLHGRRDQVAAWSE
jgi:toxin ParE1/3/4